MEQTNAALDPTKAVFYGQFVEAAYDMYASDPSSLTPPPKPLPGRWNMIAWVQMTDFAFGRSVPQFYGIVAQDPNDQDSYVLALRGTEGWIEWYDDIAAIPEPFHPVANSGLVAHGFDKIYSTLRVVKYAPATYASLQAGAMQPERLSGSFASQISELVGAVPRGGTRHQLDSSESKSGEFVVTGHSLGAALCTLYVLENESIGSVNVRTLCTFASPRVGTTGFVEAFDALDIASWRIVNTRDIVPKVPPQLIGYHHVDTEYAFDSAGMVKWSPGCWHSMKTYLHWLDENLPVETSCALAVTEELANVAIAMASPMKPRVLPQSAQTFSVPSDGSRIVVSVNVLSNDTIP